MLRTKTHLFAKVLLFTYRKQRVVRAKTYRYLQQVRRAPASIAVTSDFDSYFERFTLCRNNFDIPHCLN